MSGKSMCAFVISGFLAVSAGAVSARAGELQDKLDQSKAYKDIPDSNHAPKFRLEAFEPAAHAKGTLWYWVYDGNQRIGLVQNWSNEIEMFRAAANDGNVIDYSIPQIHHWATLLGPRINLYAPSWISDSANKKVTVVKGEGSTIEIRTDDKPQTGVEGVNTFCLRHDPKLGYVWDCTTHYSLDKPQEMEFNNLLGGGLSESRDDHKKWQKTIWTKADGKIGYFFHNPVSPGLPGNAEWRDVKAGGFVGFVTEPEVNPFVEIQECNIQVFMATCSVWYDQHILARTPTQKEADGKYHVRAKFRMVCLPGAVAKELEAAATDFPPFGKEGPVGFLQNKLNDFETRIPTDRVYNGPFWPLGANNEFAHSGKSALKISGGKGKVVEVAPIAAGPPIYGESKKRYRFSAWVMTNLKDGKAYLREDDCFWNWGDIKATRKSKELTGNSDWTELVIDFQPGPNDPFLLIKLCVEGEGSAWFDDVSLMEVKDERK